MKRMISTLMLTAILIIIPSATWAIHHIKEEPPLETQIGWDILPSGMLVVAYDLDHNGKPDFFSVRVVIKHYFSNESISETRVNFPTFHVFQVNYEKDNYFYITAKQPLFYAIDKDEDGVWDTIYKDEMEDKINGNEKFYDSPSGMFPEGDEINKHQ